MNIQCGREAFVAVLTLYLPRPFVVVVVVVVRRLYTTEYIQYKHWYLHNIYYIASYYKPRSQLTRKYSTADHGILEMVLRIRTLMHAMRNVQRRHYFVPRGEYRGNIYLASPPSLAEVGSRVPST